MGWRNLKLFQRKQPQINLVVFPPHNHWDGKGKNASSYWVQKIRTAVYGKENQPVHRAAAIARLYMDGWAVWSPVYTISKLKAALRWWCNDFGPDSQFNIEKCRLLKEFMIEHPPDFLISDKFCQGYFRKNTKCTPWFYNQSVHLSLNLLVKQGI